MQLGIHSGRFLVLAAFLAGACQPTAKQLPIRQEAAAGAPVWPEPPHRPRIRLVRAVARPQDLGFRPSFWQRVGELLGGKKEDWFVRPTGVAVHGFLIYVADPGAQALWVLDVGAGRRRALHRADGHPLVSPVAVAIGRNGRVYLADSYLGRVFVYDGEGELTGRIGNPPVSRPAGVAYDAERDHLYVADSGAHRVWIFDSGGTLTGAIGQRGTGPGEFNFPTHVTVDSKGNIYVTDALNFRLQMFHADGSFAGQFGRHGDFSGDFASPKGVAVDSEGHIYVVDALFDAVQIFDRQGRLLLTFGGRGIGAGQFWLPGGLCIDSRDRIYVADSYNQRIQIFQYLADGDDE
ncbi:MAG: 6-bladed beta-propeller [Candidatus Binatia bacterium]